jgi:protein disulfide-isomerase
MNRFPALVALALVACTANAAEWPYNEKADATVDVQHALAAAHADHKNVLLVFGANWCKDCRDLDKALHGSSAVLIDGKFHVVKIDVGNFDKNLSLAEHYGNPIKMGIPAVVELGADEHVIYSTKGGELADARKMGEQGIYDLLSAKLTTTNSNAAGGGQHLIPMSRARFWGW